MNHPSSSRRPCFLPQFRASLLWLLAAVVVAPVWPSAAVGQDDQAGSRQYNAASALHNRKLYDVAIGEWKKFTTRFPKHKLADRGHFFLGICYYETNKTDEAQKSFDYVIKTYPKFDQLETAYLYLGFLQLGKARTKKSPQKFAAAAATFSEMLKKFPRGKFEASALFYLGECLYGQGKKTEAIEAYRKMATSYSKHAKAAEALYGMGIAQQDLKQYGPAGATYGKFLKDFPKHELAPEVGVRLGVTLYERDQVPEAEKWFQYGAGLKGFRLAGFAAKRQADCLFKRKKYREAADLYLSIPAKHPQAEAVNVNEVWLEGGKAAYQAGDHDRARAALEKMLTVGGDTGSEAAHWIAQSFLKQNKPDEALAAAEKALAKAEGHKFHPDLMLDKGNALYEIPARRKDSVAAFLALVEKFPSDPASQDALYMAAFASLNTKDFPAALQHSEKFLSAYPNSQLLGDVKYVAAEAHMQSKQYDKAQPLYRDLLAKLPQHADAGLWKVRVGECFYRQKDFAQAVKALQPYLASIKKPMLKAQAYFLAGHSQVELKKHREAVPLLENALKADANWSGASEALLFLGLAHLELGELPASTKRFQELVEKHPSGIHAPEAHFRLGEIAFKQKDYKTAGVEYRKVIDNWATCPFVPFALSSLGWAQREQGQLEEAEKSFTSLIKDHSSHAANLRAYFARGLVHRQLKKYADAEADFKTFLKSKGLSALDRSDARFELGKALAAQKKLPDAAAEFQSIVDEDAEYPRMAEVLYELAWAHSDRTKPDEAAKAFELLAEKFPARLLGLEAQFHLGEIFYDKEDFKEAAKWYFRCDQRARQLVQEKTVPVAQANSLGETAAHKLGWAYYKQESYVNSEKTFTYQAQQYPEGELAADAVFMQAECLFKQDKFKDALKAYEGMKKPPSSDAFRALAALHAAQAANHSGQNKKSLTLLEDYAKKFPESQWHLEATYETGLARHKLGQLDEALKVYKTITDRTDKMAQEREAMPKAWFMTGEVYFEKKLHKQAIPAYIQVIYNYGYARWQAKARYELGRVFEVLKDRTRAITTYQEVLKHHADSEVAPLAKQRLKALGAG